MLLTVGVSRNSIHPGSRHFMARDDRFHSLLESTLLELTSAFAENLDVETTLGHVTTAAVDLVEGVDYADVMLLDGGTFRSLAPTASLATDLDHVQMRLQQGPCLEAAVADSVVRCADLRQDQRWPEFAAAAVELGVHSILSFQLYTHRNGAGAMNILSKQRHAFDIKAETTLAMLATHAAVTLIAAEKEKQFESALASRDLIGQAKGIIMERFKLDAGRAFAMLTKLSQDANIPLRQIAEKLVKSLDD
jgi:transcriptional regulator with GAF, ATPase, and Fis domain